MYPVIVALDTSAARALALARELKDAVAAFKVGWELILERGAEIVGELARLGSVIADLKVADVPHVAERVIARLVDRGACCVIVHGFLHPSVPRDGRVYVLAKMTVPTQYDAVWERLLSEIDGVRGFALPGNQPEVIARARQRLGCRFRLISPGIGPQGGAPGSAIKAGADFEIVGRYILESPERVHEWSGLRPACFSTP